MSIDADLTFFHEFERVKTLVSSHGLGPTLDCVRALATASRYNSSGIMETGLLANTGRFDHSPLNGQSRGILIEEPRQNDWLRSEDLGNVWTAANASFSLNAALGQDGQTTADKIVENGVAATSHRAEQTVTANGEYVLSVDVEPNSRNFLCLFVSDPGQGRFFDLVNGTILGNLVNDPSDSLIEYLGDGVFRCSIVVTIAGASTVARVYLSADGITQNYNGDSSSGLNVWGADASAGGFPLSYVGPTVGSSVIRNGDVIKTTELGWLGSSQTFFAHIKTGNIDNNTTVWSLHDGTANERIAIEITSGVMHFIGVDGGVTQWDISVAVAADTEYRIAVSWAANDIAFYLNGSQVGVDSGASLPTVTTLNIGSDHADAEFLNSHFKEARGYGARKANQFLEDLSNGLIREYLPGGGAFVRGHFSGLVVD